MSEITEGLLSKHEDLSMDPSLHVKIMIVLTYSPGIVEAK